MGRMRLSAESIEDQDVQALESFQTFRRNLIGVCAVGDIAKAKAEHIKSWAVLKPQRNHLSAQDF